MDIVFSLFFAFISFVYFVFNWKRKTIDLSLIFLLVIPVITTIFFNNFEDNKIIFIVFFISIFLLTWIFNRFFYWNFLKILPFLFSITFLFFNGFKYNLNSYEYNITYSDILFLPILISFLLIGLDFIILKFFKNNSENDKMIFHSVFLAFAFIISSFLGGLFAVFILSFFYSLHVISTKSYENLKLSNLLFVFVIISCTFSKEIVELENIIHFSTLFAISLSFIIVVLLNRFSELNLTKFFIILVLTILIVFFFGIMDSFKEHIAGISFLIIFILTFTLLGTFNFLNQNYFFLLLFSFLSILWGLKVNLPKVNLENSNKEEFTDVLWEDDTNKTEDTIKKSNLIDTLIELNSIKPKINPFYGKWNINSNKSKILFELGPPEARTKGEFQKIDGTFFYSDTVENISIKVNLPLEGLTTYNTYRDETLMEKEFFDKETQSIITFESSNWKYNGKFYKVNGNLKIKGISKKISFIMNVNKIKNNTIKATGKIVIDRTSFGMSSDTKIGDIVDCRFNVLLIR